MKKKLRILLLLIFVLSAVKGFGITGYLITARITGDANGKKVFLYSEADRKKPVDSTTIVNNKFELKGSVSYPSFFTLKVMKMADSGEKPGRPVYQPVIPIFIENTKIRIAAELDSIPDELKLMMRTYSYRNIEITGSRLNDIYLSFMEKKNALDSKRSDIFMNEYIPYLNPKKGEEKGPLSKGVEIVSRIDKAAEERDAFVKQFAGKNHDNYVGLYVAGSSLAQFTGPDIDELLSVFQKGGLLSTEPGIQFVEKAGKAKKTAIGSKYVDLDVQDQNGKPVRFSDFVAKGRYVLLEFWASWCGPCKADIPHLKEVYELYHPEGFDIVSVSVDENRDAWIKAIGEFGLTWPQVSDLKAFKGDVTGTYGITGVPTCILLGPDGTIITRNMRGSWMDKKLIGLYGNKFGSHY